MKLIKDFGRTIKVAVVAHEVMHALISHAQTGAVEGAFADGDERLIAKRVATLPHYYKMSRAFSGHRLVKLIAARPIHLTAVERSLKPCRWAGEIHRGDNDERRAGIEMAAQNIEAVARDDALART